jgi:hypothetical protein
MGSLLDILQGHQPEELSREPTSVVDPMFDILLELASESDVVTNDQVNNHHGFRVPFSFF